MPPLLLLWTDTAEAYRKALAEAGLADRLRIATCPRAATPDAETLAACDAMLAWGVPPGLLPRMPRLRWIQALTAGVESWLALPDLREGIALCCARGTHRLQMPENILGALFHITKPFQAIVEDQRRSRWTRQVPDTLAGKTLGILGLGAIGQELARKAAALEMRVIGTRRNPEPVPHAEVFPPERTDEVLAQSDYVLLLLPVTPHTVDFMNAARLSRMKASAWLLNFGRGQLVVDDDLVAAVREKRIAGAVLDVFRREPLPPGHPFWTTPGILVLPHIGGVHADRDSMVAKLLVENTARFLDGQPLQALVDRETGY